jgi:hypothetical protein
MEQGAITIADVVKEPLASRHPISSGGYVHVASDRNSPADLPSSRNAVLSPERDRIKWTSTPDRALSFCRSLQP